MGRTIHVSLSVRGVLNWSPKQLRQATSWILKPDGTRYTPAQLRDAMMDELAEGHEVLPMGECEGFDFKTGCPGHETPSAEPEVTRG